MPNWKQTTHKAQKLAVLLFDGFSNHCLANTVEPLRAANMLSGKPLYEWSVLTIDGTSATSSSRLEIAANAKLAECSGDALYIMPSYRFREHSNWQTQLALRSARKRFKTIAGLDMGAWLMADAGLLSGYRATVHWEELTAFAERFPEIEVIRERYILDRNRITCSGAHAAFDLIHHLIGQSHGEALSLEVAGLLMSHSVASKRGALSSDKAVSLMETYIENPLTIGQIAKLCGNTQKALENRMRKTYGASPRTVYRRLRLNHARKLVQETSLTISEIALRSGYENPAALTRAFKAEFAVTPRDIRKVN